MSNSLEPRVLLCDDDDLIKLFPKLEDLWPRFDSEGNVVRDWRVQHRLASTLIERRLRAAKAVPERFDLGRLSPRSLEDLREAAACFAVALILRAADSPGDDSGFIDRNAKHFEAQALAALNDVSLLLDYDVDNSGDVSKAEAQQPFPVRMIRG